MIHKKIFIISESISAPFDEGFKNVVYHLITSRKIQNHICIATKKDNNTSDIDAKKINLNKLFLTSDLRQLLRTYSPDIVLYIPDASYTLNSFIRAKVLKCMSLHSKVVVLGMQRRKHGWLSHVFLRYLKPELLLLLSKADKELFKNIGIRVEVLPPAIDTERFFDVAEDVREILRKKYDIAFGQTVVTHVGHIRESRNLECLLHIQNMEGMQVVVVGSTTTSQDQQVYELLRRQGVKIIDQYIEEIQEIYQLSDIYIFPVKEETAAIEMPLSVLEAMACNLPIITTRFGGLIDYFAEDKDFRYFDSLEDLIRLVKETDLGKANVNNRRKVEHFTWDNFTNQVMQACDELK